MPPKQTITIPDEFIPIFNDISLQTQAMAEAYAAGLQDALKVTAIRFSKQNPASKETPENGPVQPE